MRARLKLKVFVDTNVLIDYLLPAREQHGAALDVFGLIFASKIEAAFTTQSILDAAYVVQKCTGAAGQAFRTAMTELLKRTNVDSISHFNLRDALQDPDNDLEDNAQLAFALDQCCDVVLTHDRSLLSSSVPAPLLLLTPEAFLEKCRG